MPLCLSCYKSIPPERKALGFDKCAPCTGERRKLGALSFDHKTGGSVQALSPETYAQRKRYSSRRGKRSNLGSFFGRYT